MKTRRAVIGGGIFAVALLIGTAGCLGHSTVAISS